MSGGIEDFYVHTVSVETYLGQGVNGDRFAAPADVVGFLEDKRHLVRNSDGEQVIASSSFYTYPANGQLFTPDSKVTRNGTTSRVITVGTFDSAGLGLPDHVAVDLT